VINADSAGLAERKVVLTIARVLSSLVYVYLIVVEIILLMGFVLLLFGANPSAGFTEWVYRNLDRVMEPFRGIFTPVELGVGGSDVASIFETSVLFAMIVYGILALVFSGVIAWLSGRLNQIETAETERERRAEYQERLAAIAAPDDAQRAAQAAWLAAQASAGQVPSAPGSTARTDPTVVSVPPPGAVPPSPPHDR
jgi:uncharacterized protein YggT (Ycf19 family)